MKQNSSVSKHCHMLRDGKIAKCSLPILYGVFKDKLNYTIPNYDNDIIDIYQCTNGWEIYNKFHRPIECCRYCYAADLHWFKW